ncbi:CoA transferase [Bradyrhizobium huanghuaihaiense]|uniref:CaiB/BaiF CoA transferase family protein n=1 Tax=Bradyrhizobium huanghuaihaiense TaxID=990078 RepID=UPI0021AA8D08|nr:CaiB/BaiF CoA-transferase family protein [Bradyrhizobium sp. CB3035]UWU75836.1 CoA transferase [Bradyrhizobium sp. CB3035]
MPSLPLSGFKVLDLTRVLAGPMCAQILGDLGADVIKIERPATGDESRSYGPPCLEDPEGKPTDDSYFFLCANRNKRSVTVNLTTSEGQEIIRALAKVSDVMMENYKVGDLKRFGLDYESIRKINPNIVYCSITGYGQSGPYATRAGYDAVFQATTGMMSLIGHADGEPGAGPMMVPLGIIDYMTGQNAAIAVLAALHHRKAGRRQGQHIDVCLFDSAMASLSHLGQQYLESGKPRPRCGNRVMGNLPSGVYHCDDGELILMLGNNGQFARACAALGLEHLSNDPDTIGKGSDLDGDALRAIFAARLATNKVAHWLAELGAAAVPCGPVNDLAQAFADPHACARGIQVNVPHPLDESLTLIRNPLTFSATPLKEYRYPPRLGEHTQKILSSVLGYDERKIAELRRSGAI